MADNTLTDSSWQSAGSPAGVALLLLLRRFSFTLAETNHPQAFDLGGTLAIMAHARRSYSGLVLTGIFIEMPSFSLLYAVGMEAALTFCSVLVSFQAILA